MAHTPGPWKVMKHLGKTGIYDICNNYLLAVVEDWQAEAEPEAEANAKLLAAAPELLLVVKGILESMEQLGMGGEDEVNGGDCVEAMADWMNNMREAISLAETGDVRKEAE